MSSDREFDPYATDLKLVVQELNPPVEDNLERIGNYELLRLLGKGGMGEVFLARHSRLEDRLYALKTILQQHADPEGIARFNREIAVLAKLAHPNLLYAFDAGEHDGKLYLVTDFVDGIDLGKLVKKVQKLQTADACEIVRQMAVGLAAAHEKKIVHRDIKPSNVMLTRSGNIKVLDLGLALMHDNTESQLTGFRAALGTPEYMSPEQWAGSHDVTAAADIYSLGCTLYFLLSGNSPFPANTYRTLPALMRAHLQEVPPKLAELDLNIDPELSELVNRCLAKKPTDRPPDCMFIASKLETFCRASDLGRLASNSCDPLTSIVTSNPSPQFALNALRSSEALPEKNDDWKRLHEFTFDWNWKLLVCSVLVLAISLISLSIAYFGPGTTETWTRRFDRLQDRSVPPGTGFLIEAGRALLFLGATAAVCLYRFSVPLRRFFSPKMNETTVWIARIVVVVLVSFFLMAEFGRHWNAEAAGADMVEWGKAHQIETTAEKEIVPYRWYLPYSLCNYLFIFIGLIACPSLQFLLSDYRYLRARLAQLGENLESTSNAKAKLALLHRFGLGCRDLTSRYVDAAGVLAIGIHYEYWIGRWTLSDDGFATEVLAQFVVTIMVLFFLMICHVYAQGIELAGKSFEASDFEQEQSLSHMNLYWFLKTSLVNRLSGIACLSLLIVAGVALLT
jgi:serine/threonine protein kinase